MPGITPAELANLLDSGLEPNQISYLCFTRWRFRRGELTEGMRSSSRFSLTTSIPGPASRPVREPLGHLTA